MDSITGKVELFQNATQTMWMNFINSDVIKFVVDLGTALMKLFDKLPNIAKIPAIIGAVLGIKKLITSKDMNLGTIFESIVKIVKDPSTAIASVTQGIINLSGVMTTLTTKISGTVVAEGAATIATTTFGAAVKGLATSFMSLLTTIAPYALAIAAIGAAIWGVVKIVDNFVYTVDEAKEDIQQSSEEIKNLQNDISSLNTELEETNDRINELLGKGTLSFVENEELNKLKEQRAELERTLEIQKELLKIEERKMYKAASTVAGEDPLLNKTTTIASTPQILAVNAAKWIASKFTGQEFAPYTGIKSSTKIDDAISDLNNNQATKTAQEKELASMSDKESKTFKKTQKEIDKTDEKIKDSRETLLDYRSQLVESYGSLTWQTAEEGKELEAWQVENNKLITSYLNNIDKIDIALGSATAKQSAFNRLFGKQLPEGLQKDVDELEKLTEYEDEYAQLNINISVADSDLKDAEQELADIQKEAEDLGVDTSITKYGNIDLNDRGILEWNEENLNKYQKQIESWGMTVDELRNSYSTVLGSYETFGDEEIPIAFSPMLKTEEGLELLDSDLVYRYINNLIRVAKENGETPTYDVLMRLDTEGLSIDGKQIQGLLADVGENAEKVSQSMHFAGTDGAINDAERQIENAEAAQEAANDALEELKQKDYGFSELKIDLKVSDKSKRQAEQDLAEIENEAQAQGIDLAQTKTKFGNVDLNNRESIEWNSENISKYQTQIESLGMSVDELAGKSSSVMSLWDEFNTGSGTIPIAFSPILQTDNGPEVLSSDTIDTYINGLISTAKMLGVEPTRDILLQLDSKGFMVEDKKIQGILADVGEEAEKTSKTMDITEAYQEVSKVVDQTSAEYDAAMKTMTDSLQKFVDERPELKAFLDESGISLEELAEYLTRTGNYATQAAGQIATAISTIDTLTASVDTYKAALTTVESIAFEGQAISEDYYKTLKEGLNDVTVASQGFSDAIAEQNGKYIVKNITLLGKLINQSKKAKQATIQVTKAQALLQYKQLINNMSNYIRAAGVEMSANGYVTQSFLENIDAMQSQIESIKQLINQYTLLEISMTKAANAFDEYEKAKERDGQLSYDDSMLEMLKTIDEGLLKNETGTEAFEFAVKALVPEEFWKDIDDVDEKIKSIHDYLDGDNTFSRFFYVDGKTGDLDITTDNVREFVDLCITNGLFEGDSKNFILSNSVNGIKDFADALGVTEPVVLAMLTALEKVDATWGNVLTDVMTNPIEREVNRSIDGVEEATDKLDDFWENAAKTGKFDATEYQTLCQNLDKAKTAYEQADQAAKNNAQQYNLVQTALAAYRGEIALTGAEADQLAKALGLVDANGNPNITIKEDGSLELTDSQVEELLKKLGILKEPSLIYIQSNYDTITAQIDALRQYIDGEITDPSKNEVLVSLGVEDKATAQQKLDELVPQQKNIEVTYGITETSSEEQKSVLEGYKELAENGLEFDVLADVTEAQEALDEVNNNNPEDKTVMFLADSTQASSAISGIAQQLSALPDDVSITITTTEKRKWFDIFTKSEDGDSDALGTATNGKTLLSEVGTEMVVDPQKGIYYTVGENGPVMETLPRGAIVFNHKQTKELLEKGHTGSRGKITDTNAFNKMLGGSALAHGNAAPYGIPSYHPNLKDETSFANYTRVNTKWDKAASTLLASADALSDASDSASDAFEETLNWIEVLFTRIDNSLSEHEAYLATITDNINGLSDKNEIYQSMFGQLYAKHQYAKEAAEYYRQLAEKTMEGLDEDTKQKIRHGTISIEKIKGTGDETGDKALQEQVEQINEAIEYYNEYSNYTQQYYSTIEEIANKALERQQEVSTAYENEIGLVERHNSMLEARNDLLETSDGFATKAYYDAQIKNNKTMLEQYQDERNALQAVLNAEVAAGNVKIGDQQWYDMVNAIYDVDDAIIDTQSSIEDLQNSINDLHWAKFDELMNRFGYLEDELGNIVQLLSHDVNGLVPEELDKLLSKDWANDSGLTTLGLYAQQMEMAQHNANQYAEAIKELKQQYAAGRYNETEYLNKLNELTSAQYENIEKYYDSRDAIVELNEARVDGIKNAIQKELDVYQELIDNKKEELNTEKGLKSFQNEIAEKEKDVANLKKQLAAMAGDTTAATTAKRKQLEAELLDAQKALEESYYDHSISSRQEALDKEYSSFEEEKNKEIENWEEYLKNVDTVVADSLNYVKGQTESIYSTLTGLGQQYGLSLSENITTPWSEGSIAVDNYSTKFETACSAWTTQLDNIASHWKTVQAEAEAAAASQLKALNQQVTDTQGAGTNSNPPTSNNNIQQQQKPVEQPKPAAKAITVGGKINAGSARIYANSYGGGGGRQYFTSDPIYTVLKEQNGYLLVRHHSLSSGYTGWFKKSDVKAYAQGTLGTKKNGFSLIDELGDELVLRAGADGKLSYLTKGTGVVPADITEKIIDIATDPIGTLSDMMPKTQLPSVETKDFNFEFNFDSLLHVDNASQDSIPALKKMIRSEFNQMLSGVNSKLKRA